MLEMWWKTFFVGILLGAILVILAQYYFRYWSPDSASLTSDVPLDHLTYVREAYRLAKIRGFDTSDQVLESSVDNSKN